MVRYSEENVAEVLAANDIVDVIGAAIDLQPAGASRYKALCPFHQEKTPSFSVSRERQAFYCFGCQKGGDAITFIRDYEGVSFGQALRQLADRAGIRLPEPGGADAAKQDERGRLIELGGFAARHFRQALDDPLKGAKGKAYLQKRQLSGETIERFRLGYACPDWSDFADAARAAGHRQSDLLASGLVRERDRGGCYDFFRDRLMFPIRDVAGNDVAFGGRDLSGESPAKYINSPENALYKKGKVLYGLHECRDVLRHEKRAVLVEGYFDLLRCYDVGIKNVVATCGTALTGEQARLIRRYVPEVVLVYDGDPAGIRAALRGVSVLTQAGLAVRALALPSGQDPDDFVLAEGAEALRKLLEKAADFVTFYIEMNAERADGIEGRTDIARELFEILRGLDDPLRCDEYLKRVARELKLSEWAVRSEFTKALRANASRRPVREEAETAKTPAPNYDDCLFMAALLDSEPLRTETAAALEGVRMQPGPVAEVLYAVLKCGDDIPAHLASEEAKALFAAAANTAPGDPEQARLIVQKRTARLMRQTLESQMQGLQEAIRKAQEDHDTARVNELLPEVNRIGQQIQALGAA